MKYTIIFVCKHSNEMMRSNDLNWDKHKCVISLKLTKTIGVLNRLRYEYPEEISLTLYNTLILPHLNYCIPLWGANTGNIHKLLKKCFTDYF